MEYREREQRNGWTSKWERERESRYYSVKMKGYFNRDKRESWIKIIINPYDILFRTVPKLSRYYSMLQNFDTFGTPHEAWIVVSGMSNVKYLVFDTLDGNAFTQKKQNLQFLKKVNGMRMRYVLPFIIW